MLHNKVTAARQQKYAESLWKDFCPRVPGPQAKFFQEPALTMCLFLNDARLYLVLFIDSWIIILSFLEIPWGIY